MKNFLILGVGIAGIMMVNYLVKKLLKGWKMIIVDKEEIYYYQLGYLFFLFDIYKFEQVIQFIDKFIFNGVELICFFIQKINKMVNEVVLENGVVLFYDVFIIVIGINIVLDEIEGMLGDYWQKEVFDFYIYEGVCNLCEKLMIWFGGKMVVYIVEMLIKCLVVLLEFVFLVDFFFKNKGMWDKVDIIFVILMDGVFIKFCVSKELSYLLE